MNGFRSGLFLLLAIPTFVVACGGGGESAATTRPPDTAPPPTGRDLLDERVIGTNAGCVTCHSFTEDVTLVGPPLAGLGQRAAGRVPGMTGEEYVRQSILEPDSYVVPGFAEGQMIGGWDEMLTPEQIDSLVLVLLEL